MNKNQKSSYNFEKYIQSEPEMDIESIKKGLLILDVDKVDYSLQEWEKNGVNVDFALKKHSIIFRAIRRFWVKFHLPFQSIWYGKWKRHLSEYNTIILHGSWLVEGIPHWIRKKGKKSKDELKIIWWYWNRVMNVDSPNKISEKDCEKWSFDQVNCREYNMKFNTQYYFESFKIPEHNTIKNDIYHLGSDGGRLPKLMELYQQFEQMNLKVDYNILTMKHSIYHEKYPNCFIEKKLEYKENLRHIGECKAILEIIREDQSGQTLRALEALFHQKKLITNDLNIESMNYYHPDNVFILGKNEIEQLPEFLERPYHPIPKDIIDLYESKSWLKRFFDKKVRKK